jgi:hypothetical protein
MKFKITSTEKVALLLSIAIVIMVLVVMKIVLHYTPLLRPSDS